ncbi:hypothetical protein [Colwellia psychrerythraea]|uniref:Uncharacterized protein n=1 Tax=Colwellia psychrerythraea TaxID=28229 RepID=A0A099L0A4_COLPS|nr:hypothetical protein [Colwellia psychrerythraea]KGJ96409.1 hypothetical protein GAB14E_0356 [Colwellia psychrerythraea]
MYHKSLWLSIFIIVLLSAASHFLDFGHGLVWVGFETPKDFFLLLLRLLFLSLIVERVVELYVILYRAPGRAKIENDISLATGEKLDISKLSFYKAETARKTAWVGFSLGVLMAIVGIRIFTGMFDFDDASTVQIIMFDVFELFTMGALMAGGSKGINQIVSTIEFFAQRPKRLVGPN